jgi:hypothetical protein
MHQEERNSGQKKPAHPRRSVQDNQYESVLKKLTNQYLWDLIVVFRRRRQP